MIIVIFIQIFLKILVLTDINIIVAGDRAHHLARDDGDDDAAVRGGERAGDQVRRPGFDPRPRPRTRPPLQHAAAPPHQDRGQ